MPAITQELLDQTGAELEAAGHARPESCFGLAYLEHELKLPREKALQQVAYGPNDYGLDGFHLDPALKNLSLFEFQWSSARSCFQTPFQCLAGYGMDRIFGADPPGIAPDQFLTRLKSEMLTYQDLVERVFIHLVFRGDTAEAEQSVVYAKLREDLENKKHLVDAFFGRPVTLVFQFRSVSGASIGALAHQRVTHSYPLRLERSIEMGGPSGEVMRVGFARLLDLHAMYKEMKQRFFESNIRAILSESTPTNRAIAKAFEAIVLEKKTDPLALAFDHNGVTLHAEKIEEQEGGLLLTEPRLLNGAQTIATFDRFLQAGAADPRMAAGQAAMDELSVLCKIISGASPEFVLQVTLSNNRQNPIKPWNLHANDLIQLELQDKFQEDLKIYYERQEKAFANLQDEAPEDSELREEKAVELVKLAQTFLLSDGELEKNSRLQEVFENEADYRSCFHDSRLQVDSRKILLCYKAQFRLSRLIKEIVDKGEKKYAYLKRARSLVWALLLQAVLNDARLEAQAAAFGKSLAIEQGYAAWLQKLASSRLRPLISKAVEKEPYARKLKEGQYGFLKTRAFYLDCLKRAPKNWGWTLKKLGGGQ